MDDKDMNLHYATIDNSRVFDGEDDGDGATFCNFKNVRAISAEKEEIGWCITFSYDEGPTPEDFEAAFASIEEAWAEDGLIAKVNPMTAESFVMVVIPVDDNPDHEFTVTQCIMARAGGGIKRDGAATRKIEPDEPESLEFALLAFGEMARAVMEAEE